MLTLRAHRASNRLQYKFEFNGEWTLTELPYDGSKWNFYMWDGERISYATVGDDYTMNVDNGRNGTYDFRKYWQEIVRNKYSMQFISADRSVHCVSVGDDDSYYPVYVTIAGENGRTEHCCVSPNYKRINRSECISADRTTVYMTNIVETEKLPNYRTINAPLGDIVAMSENYGGIWAFGRTGNVLLKDIREPGLNPITPSDYMYVDTCGYATDGVITTVVCDRFLRNVRLFDVRNMKQYSLDTDMPRYKEDYIITAFK